MNTKQIKIWFINNDITPSRMAEKLAVNYPASELSIRQMISDMTYERRWYPTLAAEIERQFGLRFVRPKHYEPVRRLKQAA